MCTRVCVSVCLCVCVFVYECVCVYVCTLYMYTMEYSTCVCLQTCVCMYVYIHVCACASVCVHVCAFVNVHFGIDHVCVCVCRHVGPNLIKTGAALLASLLYVSSKVIWLYYLP